MAQCPWWRAFAAGSFFLLASCGGSPSSNSVTETYLPSAVVSTQYDSLTPQELARVSNPDVGAAYVLGPDDLIATSVYQHPELSAPFNGSTAANGGSGGGGALITSDGTVELPLIGSVKLGGLTLAQAQQLLENDYAQELNNPKVAIELVQPQSLRYYLLGAFTTPGVKYPLHPLTLLEALALGGSVDIQNADLYQAYVAQGNIKLPVDLNALLVQGDLSQNVSLASGDVIVIPTSQNENAFVFGAVTKPGPVPFESGSLSLLQALSGAQFDLNSLTNAELTQIHIIRANGKQAEFFIVNAAMILNGKAASFNLVPGDIVFVPPSPVASWDQALNELIPFLSVVSDALNPFVSIKYLRQRN